MPPVWTRYTHPTDRAMIPIRRIATVSLALTLGLSVARCGGGDGGGGGTPPPTEQVPTTIQIANDDITFDAIGETEQLAVTVLDQDGRSISNPPLQFTSQDTDVASVSSGGLVTAEGNGNTQILVASGSAQASADVTVDQEADGVAAVSGDAQSGQVAQPLGSPLVVRVVDSEGNGVEGVDVDFEVISGGGSLSATSATTDASGEASVDWTLGETAGQQSVRASVGSATATFTATAEPGPPAAVAVTGDGQQGVPSFALLESIGVRVEDEFGNGVDGAEVQVTATAGGSADPAVFDSDAGGDVVDWTLGGTEGTQNLTFTVAGLPDETISAEAVAPRGLAVGVAVQDVSGDPGQAVYFTVDVPAAAAERDPAGAAVIQTVLRIRVEGGLGDRDLLLRLGSPPEGREGSFVADCVDIGPGVVKECTIESPGSGTWFAAVIGPDGFSDATVIAVVETRQPDLTAGALSVSPASPNNTQTVTISGTVTNNGDLASGSFTWRIDVDGTVVASATIDDLAPGASEPVAAVDVGPFAVGTRTATLTVDPADVVMDADRSDNTSEVDFEVSAIPTGTITIQKVIQSADGGAADNPADPALDGFEFQILEDGTQNVIATVTTDATGQAQATVTVGEYDVVESDSKGLTDVTQAAGASVSDGGDVPIEWINRQADIPTGTLTIQKVIQSSDGGAPDNPADPALDGFQFQIRDAGTDNLVATVTTDASGQAQATLDVGDYDIVESDSKGLTDVTQAANGVTVADGANTDQQWINRQPAPGQGTITIQKVIQSSSGGTADNPANPSLSGFVFEVREANTTTAAATVTTDANGQAQATLGVGTYDVVETNSQGLTDVTQLVEDLSVTDGGNVDVDWINRQAPLPTGTITIQKVIQSSSGGTPDNPSNPSLSGFVFEVREANTTTAAATVTTGANGQAQATVEVGTYDVVETNSQGLTDVTQLVEDLSVTDGGNVDVDWINQQDPPTGNQAPTPIINAAPTSIPSGDGNATTVMLFGGNSTDPEGDPLTFTWAAPNGTFEGGVNTGEKVNVTFPGTSGHDVTLTVDDGQGNQPQTTQTITVDPALDPAGTFDIVIEFVNNADTQQETASQQQAFADAEARWEQIIRSELGNVTFGSAVDIERSCTGTDPDGDGQTGDGVNEIESGETLDDLKIFVFLEEIDGEFGILGSAGPCFFRSPAPTGLPVVGTMRFDVADLDRLEAEGTLGSVILHEMGHVLGIGTLWVDPSVLSCRSFGHALIVNPSTDPCARTLVNPPPDTRYTGTAGVEAYRSMGAGNTENTPIENGDGNNAGLGSRDGHWRQRTFGDELMTFQLSGSAQPLSKLTIATLEDVGYIVNYAPADPFTLSDPIQTVTGIQPGGELLLDDIRTGPIWIVDENGDIRPAGSM